MHNIYGYFTSYSVIVTNDTSLMGSKNDIKGTTCLYMAMERHDIKSRKIYMYKYVYEIVFR